MPIPPLSIGNRRSELRGNHRFIVHGARLVGDIVLHADVSVWFNVWIRAENDRAQIGEDNKV